jgi:hypothetical protein
VNQKSFRVAAKKSKMVEVVSAKCKEVSVRRKENHCAECYSDKRKAGQWPLRVLIFWKYKVKCLGMIGYLVFPSK